MKGIWLFVTLCALVFTQGRSLAQDKNVTYTITDLGTLGGTSSVGCGLNSRGEVVGFSSIVTGQTDAFRWSDGKMTDLGTLRATFSAMAATSINTARWLGIRPSNPLRRPSTACSLRTAQ